ncbi:unnamed protein product [Lampetra fluviatilis]
MSRVRVRAKRSHERGAVPVGRRFKRRGHFQELQRLRRGRCAEQHAARPEHASESCTPAAAAAQQRLQQHQQQQQKPDAAPESERRIVTRMRTRVTTRVTMRVTMRARGRHGRGGDSLHGPALPPCDLKGNAALAVRQHKRDQQGGFGQFDVVENQAGMDF